MVYSMESLSIRDLLLVAALTRNQNPCPAPVKLRLRAFVLVRSVAREVYSKAPPESMPVSVGEVEGRYWREYLVPEEEEDEMAGQQTVMEVSSASRSSMQLFMVDQGRFLRLILQINRACGRWACMYDTMLYVVGGAVTGGHR